ncbi:MAG TPA: LysM peptidoglycan-binding domain-containing protein [Microbacteriaceae bacterium]|nr:LysM peptidoglycan-binding domain-containing protein [Microbacteriaceae bacterium]
MSAITISPSPSSFGAPRPARSARSRLRLTPRGRAVLLFLIGMPIALWLLVAQLNGGAATGSLEGGSVQIVMVEPGESLWSIAERVAPGSDPRDVIDAIVAFNHLGSADVMAGQQLGVPAPYGR